MPESVPWRETALKLTKVFHQTPELIESEVGDYLKEEFSRTGTVIVMCSGGADSVATVLWAATAPLLKEHRIGVFYCDHGLRTEAKGEARFVQALADALGFDFYTNSVLPGKDLSSENGLRCFREIELGKVIDGLDSGVAAILTGHQADDVAENFIFRLARGSGLQGLSGMRPVQARHGWPIRLRPLLRWRRDALRSALVKAGAQWCEDASNGSDRYTRNRIRRNVIPALEKGLPERAVVEGMLSCQRELRRIEAWIELEATQWLRSHEKEGGLSRSELRIPPVFVQRRVIQKFIRRWAEGLEPSEKIVDSALEAGNAKVWQLSAVYSLVLENGRYQIVDRAGALEASVEPFSDLELTFSAPLELPDGATVQLDRVDLDPDLKSKIIAGEFPPSESVWIDQASGPLAVRSWLPGDRYQPLGAPGTRKLQDCFVDAGIEQMVRGKLPIVCDHDGDILWIPGLPPSHSHRLRSNTTQALRLTYKQS